MKTKIVIPITILLISSISCSFTSPLSNQQSTAASEITPANQSGEHTGTTPSPTRGQADMSSAKLNLEDLPSGFAEISQEQIAMTGMDIEEMLRSTLLGQLQEAELINSTAFALMDPQNLQMVYSTVVYPLTTTEKISYDLVFFDPNLVIKPILENFSSQITTITVPENLGSKAAGFSFDMADSSQTGGIPMKGELYVFRRNTAVAILLTAYPQGTTPTANAGDLASTLDGRLINVLGE